MYFRHSIFIAATLFIGIAAEAQYPRVVVGEVDHSAEKRVVILPVEQPHIYHRALKPAVKRERKAPAAVPLAVQERKSYEAEIARWKNAAETKKSDFAVAQTAFAAYRRRAEKSMQVVSDKLAKANEKAASLQNALREAQNKISIPEQLSFNDRILFLSLGAFIMLVLVSLFRFVRSRRGRISRERGQRIPAESV